MELSHLVHAVRAASRSASRGSLAVRFLLLGGLAFGLKSTLFGLPTAARPLVVEVEADASPSDRERAVEEAILLDVAERAGLPRVDAVVRDRMLERLMVVEDVSDPNLAVERGLALGLHRRDRVARERLLGDARELLVGTGVAPSESEALAHLAAHPDAYSTPPRVRFRQLFLSRERRGEALLADAAALKRRLDAGEVIDEMDAWPWSQRDGQPTERRLDAQFGAGFGARVFAAPTSVWTGPLASSFGLHFVYVDEVVPSAQQPVAAVLPRVRAELAEQARERARRARLADLRRGYAVAWVTR